MIKVLVVDTAADADALSGTDLERNPGPGVLLVYAASTVNTATITAVVGEANIVRSQAIVLRANGVPAVNEDQPVIMIPVEGGEKNVVAIAGTTGTVQTLALWLDEEEAEDFLG